MVHPAKAAGELVTALFQAVEHGQSRISSVPGLLKQVIRENAWQRYVLPQSSVVHTYSSFKVFAEECLFATIEDLEAICKGRGDMEALSLLTEVTKGKQGQRNDLVNNVNEVVRPQGNTSTYALRRLRKDREDLHAKVTSGEMTTNAAMVQAGFRQKQITIMLDPARAARTINRHFDKAQRKQLIELIESPKE